MQIIDAVGLATFAFLGASKAANANLGFFAIIFMAVLTAVGGGLLRDIVISDTPQILYRDFYASPSLLLGFFYAVFQDYMTNPFLVFLLIMGTFFLRLFAIRVKLNLWVPIPPK